MANARVQHRHGTKAQFDANKSYILSDELVVVDSGEDTESGSAVYYKTNAANAEPVRLQNAGDRGCFPRIVSDVLDPSVVGVIGEIVYYEEDQCLYFCAGISPYGSGYNYDWVRIHDDATD